MAANPDDIRQAMADRISAVFNTNGVQCAVFARDVRTSSYPRVIVLPDSGTFINYNATMNGSNTLAGLLQLSYLVEVKTAASEPESAQIALAQFIGSGASQKASVPDAIESLVGTENTATPQLGGNVEHVNVNTCSVDTGRDIMTVDQNGNTSPSGMLEFTATIQVDVYARKV